MSTYVASWFWKSSGAGSGSILVVNFWYTGSMIRCYFLWSLCLMISKLVSDVFLDFSVLSSVAPLRLKTLLTYDSLFGSPFGLNKCCPGRMTTWGFKEGVGCLWCLLQSLRDVFFWLGLLSENFDCLGTAGSSSISTNFPDWPKIGLVSSTFCARAVCFFCYLSSRAASASASSCFSRSIFAACSSSFRRCSASSCSSCFFARN